MCALPEDNAGYANGINVFGQVAGWSGPSNDVAGATATLNEGGVPTPLGTLGGSRSVAFGLDDAGRVVGWSDLPGDAVFHAFAWVDGEMSDLGTLGGLFSLANTATASGPVVGWSTTPAADGPQHAFVHAGGEMADLNALIPAGTGWALTNATAVNASGQIAGIGTIGGLIHAFLATPATVTVDAIADEVEGFALPRGTENSLLAKLASVRTAVEGARPAGRAARSGPSSTRWRRRRGRSSPSSRPTRSWPRPGTCWPRLAAPDSGVNVHGHARSAPRWRRLDGLVRRRLATSRHDAPGPPVAVELASPPPRPSGLPRPGHTR